MANIPAIHSASKFPSCPIQSHAPSPRQVSSSLQKFISPAAILYLTSIVSLHVCEGCCQEIIGGGKSLSWCQSLSRRWVSKKNSRAWSIYHATMIIELLARSAQIQVWSHHATHHHWSNSLIPQHCISKKRGEEKQDKPTLLIPPTFPTCWRASWRALVKLRVA